MATQTTHAMTDEEIRRALSQADLPPDSGAHPTQLDRHTVASSHADAAQRDRAVRVDREVALAVVAAASPGVETVIWEGE